MWWKQFNYSYMNLYIYLLKESQAFICKYLDSFSICVSFKSLSGLFTIKVGSLNSSLQGAYLLFLNLHHFCLRICVLAVACALLYLPVGHIEFETESTLLYYKSGS